MYYGGDYNPEQWPEEVWLEDVRLMREAHVNLVSLGVFSWSRIQADENEWDFDWLDRVLDLLYGNGIGVNLATATASLPHWAVRRYPDIQPQTADGVSLGPGSRQHYSATSPDYRRLASALVARIAERYAHHPAVQMWHVNNEFACHVNADYSDHAAAAFRSWLRARYGDIDALNAAWGTAFWSQRYGSFEEVLPPRRMPSFPNPGALLDFRRFTSDSVLELYTMEREIIRAAGAKQPITTNFMGAFEPMDYWRWAEEVDLVADDSYPDPRDPDAFRTAAFTRDLMRSLKPGVPWLLMEQAPNAVNWRESNALKRPGQMTAWSEQALAHGARGIMFFQWRQSVAGSEKFHSAMLPHAGTESRTWKEVAALGSSLADRTPTTVQNSAVAIVFDWENWWAIDQASHPAELDYLAEVTQWYAALNAAHVSVDFVRAEHDIAGYALVIAPALYLLSDAGAMSLRRAVEEGGVLVTTAFTDIVDPSDKFRAGGFAVQLRGVLGGYPTDLGGILLSDDVMVHGEKVSFRAHGVLEEFVVTTGRVTAHTGDGEPAIVRNRFGRGTSLHTTTFPDASGVGAIVQMALAEAGVTPLLDGNIPTAVEVIDTCRGLTVINHLARSVTLSPVGREELTLAPFETRLI